LPLRIGFATLNVTINQ